MHHRFNWCPGSDLIYEVSMLHGQKEHNFLVFALVDMMSGDTLDPKLWKKLA